MKKYFVLFICLISSMAFGAEIKTNNISSFLPNRINVNNYCFSEKVEKSGEKIQLGSGSKLSYKIKVKKPGIYKVLLKATGKRDSIIKVSENFNDHYQDKYTINSTLKEEELIETNIYLDKNSTELNVELENGKVIMGDILVSYTSNGGIIGMDGTYSFSGERSILLEDEKITFVPVGKGFYKIVTSDGEDVIEGNNEGKLTRSKWINEDNQIWKIIKNIDGKYLIMNEETKSVMTRSINGEVVLKENENLSDQYFSLEKTDSINLNTDNKEWKLVWNDEFDIDGLPDPSKWSFDVKGPGWVNDELQSYTDKRIENCRVENGKLIIEARKDNFNGNAYSSARVKTEGKGDWLYGKVVVRAKLPKGRGTWPAIWMMPTDNKYGSWPNSGEIDIMEKVGHEPNVIHSSMHSKNMNFMNGKMRTTHKYVSGVEDSFHDYILIWNESGISVSVDDITIASWKTDPYASWEDWPWNNRFHLILNIAVGGSWGGQQGIDDSIWPQKMEVEYVRVYQK